MTPTAEELFTRHRGELFAVAYRLLGTVSEAEDVLQDAYLRLQRADLAAIEGLPH